jgi:hypothetical protein
MNAVLHTSAQAGKPDMFQDHSQHELVLEIQGELLEDAAVRVKLIGVDATPLPVLYMDVKPLNGFKRTIHAEQIYSEATRKQAEQKAATLKKGARITLTTTLHDMRTILPHVQAVALHHQS